MPYLGRDRKVTTAELDTTARVMRTVQKQIEHYTMSLEKVRCLREEILIDRDLSERIAKSPEALVEVLESRGIPKHIAVGMAAEDFGTIGFPGGELGLWTWDCCCSGCCVTCFVNTNVVNVSHA